MSCVRDRTLLVLAVGFAVGAGVPFSAGTVDVTKEHRTYRRGAHGSWLTSDTQTHVCIAVWGGCKKPSVAGDTVGGGDGRVHLSHGVTGHRRLLSRRPHVIQRGEHRDGSRMLGFAGFNGVRSVV